MAAGVPRGYDSRADWGKGITSAMRAGEKSKSPGYPGNQVFQKLAELKAAEVATLTFPKLPSMQVTAEDISDYVKTLDTEVTKVGPSGLSASDVKVHEAWEVAQEIKSEWAKGVESFGTQTKTYSGGDAGLARQLESRTYGVNDDLSITPGTETKWIDEIGDKYGTSKENIVNIGVNDQYYDGEVPKMSLVPTQEINTGTADYDAQNQFRYPLHKDGLSYQELDHGAGYVKPTTDKKGSFAGSSAELTSVEPHKKTHISVETKAAESAALTEVIESVNAQAQEKAESADAGAKLLGIELDNNISELGVDNTQLNALIEESSEGLPYVPYDQVFPTELEPWGGTHEDNINMQTVYEPRLQEIEAEDKESYEKNLAAIEQAKRDKIKAAHAAKREKWLNRAEIAKQKRIAKELAEERAAKKQAHNLEQEAFDGGLQGPEFKKGAHQKGDLKFKEYIKDEHARKNRIYDNIKNTEKRRTEGPHQKEWTIQEKEKGLHRGEYSIQEKEGGLHKGEKIIQQKERGLHHEEPTIYGANINETWDRKESSLAVQLATHNVPMFMSEDDKQKMVSALDRMDEERHGGESEAQANIGTFMSSKDPFKFSTFAYPRDVTQNMENGHYILFYVNVQNKTKYKYEGVTAGGGVVPVGDMVMTEEIKNEGTGEFWSPNYEKTKQVVHTSWTKGASKEFDTNIDYQKRRVLAGNKGNILRSNQAHLMKGRKSYQGLDSVMKTTTRITDSVALYLPPGVSNDTTASYSNSELGMAGFLAFSFGEVVNKWKAHDFEGVADTLLNVGGTAFTETIKSLGLGAFGMLTGGEDVVGTFDKAFGQTLNPYIEVNFNSMGLRNFDYTFKFSPKSKKETQDVQDIITLFRFHMAPELKGTNHRYLTLPSTFDIHYMYHSSPETAHENQFYNKIATCVLTGCNVNYTPDGVRSFADGAPTQINMTLSFQETKMLTKQKINDGF